ncbi:MAG: nickel pincer cofactor biosynthesis protein LarC [Coriobacteriia bacterium]|nr:nickel pincer cofactor biosynthesis protein LarC [Coriobacteriia bacterium]
MIGYLDCSSGISGDKFLGALVSAGFDVGVLIGALKAVGLDTIAIETPPCKSSSISGVGVCVTENGAPRRDFRGLRKLIERAPIPEVPRRTALTALYELARAEATVHGVKIDSVHFHEIGAADTLVDLLGIALGMHELGVETLIASPIALGNGTVLTEHGELPIPAPATAALLEGVPVVSGTAGGELTTPTGAAAVRTFVNGFGSIPSMVVRRVGTGCGTRDIGLPNVAQLLLGEPVARETDRDTVVLLESNIDHLTAEELSVAAERLRHTGALDVWLTPIVMKKGRAATMLSALTDPSLATVLADRIMHETGTLGVRTLPCARRIAERDVTEVPTSLGLARFKVATLPTGARMLSVENDDAAHIAADRGLAIDATVRILEAEASAILGVQARRQPWLDETTNPSD